MRFVVPDEKIMATVSGVVLYLTCSPTASLSRVNSLVRPQTVKIGIRVTALTVPKYLLSVKTALTSTSPIIRISSSFGSVGSATTTVRWFKARTAKLTNASALEGVMTSTRSPSRRPYCFFTGAKASSNRVSP